MQVTSLWWPGRWHIFELGGSCAFFVPPKRAGFKRSLDNEAVPSPGQGKQTRHVCACFTGSCVCRAGGACRWLGPWVNTVLCTLSSATVCVVTEGEPHTPPAVCQLCASCARVTLVCSPVLRRGLCPGTRCCGGGEEACTACAPLPCFLLALQRAGLSLCQKSPQSSSSFGISSPLLVHR